MQLVFWLSLITCCIASSLAYTEQYTLSISTNLTKCDLDETRTLSNALSSDVIYYTARDWSSTHKVKHFDWNLSVQKPDGDFVSFFQLEGDILVQCASVHYYTEVKLPSIVLKIIKGAFFSPKIEKKICVYGRRILQKTQLHSIPILSNIVIFQESFLLWAYKRLDSTVYVNYSIPWIFGAFGGRLKDHISHSIEVFHRFFAFHLCKHA